MVREQTSEDEMHRAHVSSTCGGSGAASYRAARLSDSPAARSRCRRGGSDRYCARCAVVGSSRVSDAAKVRASDAVRSCRCSSGVRRFSRMGGRVLDCEARRVHAEASDMITVQMRGSGSGGLWRVKRK